jgi:hypothetical protein
MHRLSHHLIVLSIASSSASLIRGPVLKSSLCNLQGFNNQSKPTNQRLNRVNPSKLKTRILPLKNYSLLPNSKLIPNFL